MSNTTTVLTADTASVAAAITTTPTAAANSNDSSINDNSYKHSFKNTYRKSICTLSLTPFPSTPGSSHTRPQPCPVC